jgi:hypothetical protein
MPLHVSGMKGFEGQRNTLLGCLLQQKPAETGCRNLMAPQDLKELGFNDRSGGPKPKLPKQNDDVDWEARKQRGFVAGIKK